MKKRKSQKKHTKIPVIVFGLAVIMLLAFALIKTKKPGAEFLRGAAETVYGSNCDLATLPYNSAAIETIGSAAAPYVVHMRERCFDHYSFPNPGAYSPQPPRAEDNALKQTIETKRIPQTTHVHAYYNESGDTIFYYKAFLDKFEITVQPDGYDNLDLASLTCDTLLPAGYVVDTSDLWDCSGYADIYGGTQITKTVNSSTKKIIITWDFAVNSPYGGRPVIYGNNGSSFMVYDSAGSAIGALDLTNPANRTHFASITMRTKNPSAQLWSASTTSRVLIADLALNRRNYPANFNLGCPTGDVNYSGSGWCYVEPGAGAIVETIATPSGARNYHWFSLGVRGTVWKKPAAPATPIFPVRKKPRRY